MAVIGKSWSAVQYTAWVVNDAGDLVQQKRLDYFGGVEAHNTSPAAVQAIYPTLGPWDITTNMTSTELRNRWLGQDTFFGGPYTGSGAARDEQAMLDLTKYRVPPDGDPGSGKNENIT